VSTFIAPAPGLLPYGASPSIAVVADGEDVGERIAGVLAEQAGVDATLTVAATATPPLASPADVLIVSVAVLRAPEAAMLGRLRVTHPDALVIAVCGSSAGRETRRAIDGVLDGLVLLGDLETALVPTVAAVLAGQTAVPRGLRTSLRREALSYREKQILGLVVRGHTNSEIGRRLYLAESTVKSHLSSSFSKLGVKSRSEAAAVILDPDGSLGASILALAPGEGRHAAAS
jgi:DNA-binding NarL/FixJ family response regulator